MCTKESGIMISLMDWVLCTGIAQMNNIQASGDMEYRYKSVCVVSVVCVFLKFVLRFKYVHSELVQI